MVSKLSTAKQSSVCHSQAPSHRRAIETCANFDGMSKRFLLAMISGVLCLTAQAQSLSDSNTFTQNAATQGEAVIADSPTGPLGLRFSGGMIIDSENTAGQFGQHSLDNASPYLGIGVVQSRGNIDMSADLGWIERDATDAEQVKTDLEPVLNLQVRLRF